MDLQLCAFNAQHVVLLYTALDAMWDNPTCRIGCSQVGLAPAISTSCVVATYVMCYTCIPQALTTVLLSTGSPGQLIAAIVKLYCMVASPALFLPGGRWPLLWVVCAQTQGLLGLVPKLECVHKLKAYWAVSLYWSCHAWRHCSRTFLLYTLLLPSYLNGSPGASRSLHVAVYATALYD